jgi:aminomethyltransferase
MTETTPRRLPLHDRHVAAGARFAPFAGWEMPVRYTQIRDEHLAVRSQCGLFDVSHMGEVFVRGPGAIEAVQTLVTHDVAALVDGQALYTVLCTPEGGIVDDLIVYRLAADELLLCVNAGNRAKDFAWIRDHVGDRAEVTDESDDWVQLAVQGPTAVPLLSEVFGSAIDETRPFHIVGLTVDGARVWAARTGYTGEDGYELYIPVAVAHAVWDRLLAAGPAYGLVPVGLGARDSLRLEARLLLYGTDIDETTNPIEAGLSWVIRFDKGDFIGRDALVRIRDAGPTRRLRGLLLHGTAMLRGGMDVLVDGEVVGQTTSGSIAYMLEDRRIALAWLDASVADVAKAEVRIRDRVWPVDVTRAPFYRRPKAS